MDLFGFSHQHHTHVVFFKVQCNSTNPTFEFNQFAVTNITQAIHAGNAIAYLQYCSYFFQIGRSTKVAQLLTQYRTYFIWFYICHFNPHSASGGEFFLNFPLGTFYCLFKSLVSMNSPTMVSPFPKGCSKGVLWTFGTGGQGVYRILYMKSLFSNCLAICFKS